MKLSIAMITFCVTLLTVSNSEVSAAPALGLDVAAASAPGELLQARGGCLGVPSQGQEPHQQQRYREGRRQPRQEEDEYYGSSDAPVTNRSPARYQHGQPNLSTQREGVPDGELVHYYPNMRLEDGRRHNTGGGGGRRRGGGNRRNARQRQQQQEQQEQQEREAGHQQGFERAQSYTVDPREYSNVAAPSDVSESWR